MSDIKLDLNYCDEQCSIGVETRNKFLDENNSAYDAAIDFWAFTKKCFETCPYKDKHIKEAQ